ncbi:MAG: peptidoglycan editing factor PgeF [Patescibacteria group bacterium]|nr:peptidoglycan editing factor PgeF [Patescibacteria group bacterium]
MPLKFNLFYKHPEIVYGITEQADGSMGYTTPGYSKPEHFNNRKVYFRKQGINTDQVFFPNMEHGNTIVVINKQNELKSQPIADGVVTKLTGVVLAITSADCFSVYAYDPVQKVIGLAHAGWKGVAGGVVPNLIKTLTIYCQSLKKDILVGIGPGIGKCHFEIKPETLPHYLAYSECIEQKGEKIFIDLEGIIVQQLLFAGIKKENIELSKQCTYCLDKIYFSNRRDKPKLLETMISFIMLK